MGKILAIKLGGRYGELTVITQVISAKNGDRRWRCRCKCGKETVVRSHNLAVGHTQSCGCLMIKAARSPKKHGRCHTRTYHCWRNMLARCYNRKTDSFRFYGERGITVGKEWFEFASFLRDMGDCPPRMSIDRIDSNGNYEKSNCQWATSKEQGRNKRSNREITYQGRTQCVAAWAEELGIKAATIHYRLRYKWPIEMTLDATLHTTGPKVAIPKKRSMVSSVALKNYVAA